MAPRPERDPADPLIGRLLDNRYEIGARIARGGMASVYEATDIRLDRTVAVKVMHPGMAEDPDFAARFVREARAAAKLHHPNVVAVFDQGDDNGTVFLVMEFVPGETLRDVIRRESPMKPQRAIELLEPVLTALAAAHRAKLIHRDIKPENVLIPDDAHGGGIKVADFGLAKAVSEATTHTATGGVLIGTVSYVAPELVVDGIADTRADVYAAGVVLYEMLTGRKPHEGESPIQIAYKHVHEDIPAPSAVLKKPIPAYVDALVQRATARDRGMRPADARVLLHQVHRVKQALAEGITEDEELYADLALPVVTTSTSEIPEVTPDPRLYSGDSEYTAPLQRADVGAVQGLPRPESTGHYPMQPEDDERRRRGGWLWPALAVLLAILLGVGAWWFGFARYTTVPAVEGKTASQAEKIIEDAGLEYDEGDEVYSESIPAGSVVSTDPGGGDRALPGDTITVHLSLGKERYPVPVLRGKTLDEAEELLDDAHLVLGDPTEKYHEKIPEGQIINSSPRAEEQVKPGTAVAVTVSKGPAPIEVRDYTGKEIEALEKWAAKVGLELDVTEEYDEEVAEGLVISQDPSDGELVKGDTITVVVSKGPPLVEVPRVRGQGAASAYQELEDLGFTVKQKHASGYLGLGYVFSVSPGEGEMVPKGSTITLYLI